MYMVDAMNTLMRECINRHAPLRRVKVTRPPAPWLKSDEIRKLHSERNVLRVRARKYNTEETWTAFRTIRNKIKSMISKAKRSSSECSVIKAFKRSVENHTPHFTP